MPDKTCDGCRHYLGGGSCTLSMEMECADGDRELWEQKEVRVCQDCGD